VVVRVEFLQEHHLAEGALRVGRVLERVEDLLQRDLLPRSQVARLPHDTVRAFAHTLANLVLA